MSAKLIISAIIAPGRNSLRECKIEAARLLLLRHDKIVSYIADTDACSPARAIAVAMDRDKKTLPKHRAVCGIV